MGTGNRKLGTGKESMWVWECVGMWEGREWLMIVHSCFGDRKHLGIPHSARVKVFDGKTHLVIAPHQIAPFQMGVLGDRERNVNQGAFESGLILLYRAGKSLQTTSQIVGKNQQIV
jgi:hypothetical protein